MKKSKVLTVILTLLMCLSLVACGGESESNSEMSTEEAYDLLVSNATDGNYLEGWRVYQIVPELASYEDTSIYYDYCVAMRAYEAEELVLHTTC